MRATVSTRIAIRQRARGEAPSRRGPSEGSMASLSTESTPRERLSRLLTLMKRTRRFRRSALLLLGAGLTLALVLALRVKRD